MLICYLFHRSFVAECRLYGKAAAGVPVLGKENAMRSLSVAVGAAILSGLIVTCAWARVDEQKVPLDKVPKEVMETVKAKFPAADLKEAAKETENGKTTYEVSLTHKNAKIDVILTPEGKITLIEKVIAEADLPQAVAQAIKNKYPQATVKLAEEISGGDDKVSAYEVILVMADKKEVEVKLEPSGKITNEEKK
jgi:hypothetical protein